jgi:hypothetical protein
MLDYKFIKEGGQYGFDRFEKKCMEAFDEGWVPSIGQPSISTDHVFIILLEKNKDIIKNKEF